MCVFVLFVVNIVVCYFRVRVCMGREFGPK